MLETRAVMPRAGHPAGDRPFVRVGHLSRIVARVPLDPRLDREV